MARFFSDLWFVPLGIAAFFVAVIIWMRTTKLGGRLKDRLLLKIPVVERHHPVRHPRAVLPDPVVDDLGRRAAPGSDAGDD